MSKIPEVCYIKMEPWWKFWIWHKKPIQIPMVTHLTGEPTLRYQIFGNHLEIVLRKPSDPIYCDRCNNQYEKGEFKSTGIKEMTYGVIVPEIWECDRCHGRISICRQYNFGVLINDRMVMYENIN